MSSAANATFWARPAWVWAGIFAPVVRPAWRLLSGDPRVQADPVEYLLNYTGMVALCLLLVVLALTPLRVIWKQPWAREWNRHRRLIGVAAWGWGTVHVALYVLFAGGWSGIVANLDKLFILAGLVGWTLLCVLAVTSLRWWVRWLGGRRWKYLHRLVYLAAALLLYHYAAQEKAGVQVAYWLVAPLVVLQAVRVWRVVLSPRMRTAE